MLFKVQNGHFFSDIGGAGMGLFRLSNRKVPLPGMCSVWAVLSRQEQDVNECCV